MLLFAGTTKSTQKDAFKVPKTSAVSSRAATRANDHRRQVGAGNSKRTLKSVPSTATDEMQEM